MMLTGTTSSGFTWTIPDGLTSDYRFVKAYQKVKSGNKDKQMEGSLELVAAVFGSEAEENRFLEHLADEHGRADVETVYRELGEIIAAASEDATAKKS